MLRRSDLLAAIALLAVVHCTGTSVVAREAGMSDVLLADAPTLQDSNPASDDQRDVVSDGGADTGLAACGQEFVGCNPVTSSGCGPGEGCYVTAARAAMCAPAGLITVDRRCDAQNMRCAPRLQCIDGFCAALCCDPNEHSPCQGVINLRAVCNGAQPDRTTGLLTCSPEGQCSVYQQNCGNNELCLITDRDGTTRCVIGTGRAALNAVCVNQSDCPRGSTCVQNAMGMSICRQFCDPTATHRGDFVRCGAGFVCTRFVADTGICVPQ